MCDEGQRWVKWMILAQGGSVVISWNVILSSIDWLNYRFDGFKPDFWLPVCYYLPIVCMQPVIVVYSRVLSYDFQIFTGFCFSFLALVMIAVFSVSLSKIVGFYLVCLLNVIMGISNILSQNGLMGLTGILPAVYINYFMIGFGVSGLAISSIRVIFIELFPANQSLYNYTTALYFILGGLTQFSSLFIHHFLMKTKIIQDSQEKNSQNQILHQIELQTIGQSPTAPISSTYTEYKFLIYKIWQCCILIFLNFFITFLLLSQLSLRGQIDGLSYPEFVAWMIFTFNLFDLLGRLLASFYLIRNLWLICVLVMLRGLFVVSFRLVAECRQGDFMSWVFGSSFFKFLNMGLYAFSNGFVCTCLIVLASGKVEFGMKDKVGYFMTTGLVFGIFFGQVTSMVFNL